MSKLYGYVYISGLLSITVFGKTYDVNTTHPKYEEILKLIREPTSVHRFGILGDTDATHEAREHDKAMRLLELLEAKLSNNILQVATSALGFDDVKYEHGIVYVRGLPMRSSLADRIVQMAENDVPFEPLIRFMVNLDANPSAESRDALFDFLDQGHFPLTDDGCFLAYKGVTTAELNGKTTLVDHHTRTFDMTPGQVLEMPRENVDNNRNQACGAGFHVGTKEHARGFGNTMLVIKVNPRDVVSVPLHDKTKLRCCRYESINIFSDRGSEMKMPVYTEEQIKSPEFEKLEPKVAPRPKAVAEVEEPKKPAVPTRKTAVSKKELLRLVASSGILSSMKEAALFEVPALVAMVKATKFIPEKQTTADLANLAAKRHFFSSPLNARKAGRTRLIQVLS